MAGAGAVAVGLAMLLFGAFVVSHRSTMSAIASTVYPGANAVTSGGQIRLPVLWSSTFDYFAEQRPFALVNGTNQSENSSGLLFALPVAVVVFGLACAGRLRRHPTLYPLVGALGGTGVILSWMLLPIPASIGQFLLLTRAAPTRLFLPLGLASVLSLVLLVDYQARSGHRARTWIHLAAGAVFAAAQGWAAGAYLVEDRPIDLRLATVFVIVVSVGTVLALGRRSTIGFAVLAAFCLFQAARINPLERGIGPLTDSQLRRAIDDAAQRDERGGWVAFAADSVLKGTLTASGVNNISGTSPYPDRSAWQVLDPDLDDEQIWNRYAHVSFFVGAPGQEPTFALIGPDSLTVTVDPCSPSLERLGARFFVGQGVDLPSCLRPVARVPHGKTFVAIYERP